MTRKSSIYVPTDLRDKIRAIAHSESRQIVDVLERMVDLYMCGPLTHLHVQNVQVARQLPTTGDAISSIVEEWSEFVRARNGAH